MCCCCSCKATGDSEKSGFQEPYDTAAFKQSMANTKQYAAGGNFAWCKIGFTTSPGVPYNESAVENLKKYYFGGVEAPKRFPEVVVVAVSQKQMNEGVMTSRGAMESVSPPELQHAFVLRVAELVDQKVPDAALNSWLRVMLSTMFVWEFLPSFDDKSARSDSLRENAVSNYHAFGWTVLQKVYHLGLFRQRKERELGALSAGRVAQLYNQDTYS